MPQGQPGNAAEVLDRRGVPLPALPGQRNPTPYSDINRERYDYNTAHMKRDENGDLTSKYKRDWKQVLGNMLMGAAQGAQSVGPHGNALGGLIGGAGVGLGGSVASPQASTNFAFDTRRLPEIERQQAEAEHERALEAARVKAEQDQLMGRAKLGQVLAGTEHTQARTMATRAGMKDTDMLRQKQQVDIDLAKARAEAVRMGKPSYRDVEIDGEVHTIQVFPDGAQSDLGVSGRAAMQDKRLQSQEGIAADRNATSLERTDRQQKGANYRTGVQQSGANYRTGVQQEGAMSRTRMQQEGQDRRTGVLEQGRTNRQVIRTTGNAPAQVAPAQGTPGRKGAIGMDTVQHIAKSLNISLEDAKRKAEADGYVVK